MSTIRAERIEKPSYFKIAPLYKGRHKRQPYIIGFDSEAEHGKPFLFQFAHPSDHVDLLDISRRKHAGLYAFIEYLYRHCTRRDTEYLVFGFNMNYEYTQLFRDLNTQTIMAPEFEVEIRSQQVMIRVLNEKRYTFSVEFQSSKTRVKVIDAMAYFPMSLDAASKIVEVGKKLPKPKHFSRKIRHTPEFEAYAKQDAILTQRLGEKIIEWHELGDVNTCISAPMLSARIFRRKYLKTEWEPMPLDLEQYGLNSYHGGKNGYYADRPQFVKDVYNYDIRSAYPEAMQALPCVDHGKWELKEGYEYGRHAIYRITGEFKGCRYDPCYDRDGSRIRESRIEIWSTSYEIDEIMDQGEMVIHTATRWEFTSDCNHPVDHSPFGRFVTDFYEMKIHAKTAAEKQYAKLNMNSLYGKLFQKVPIGGVGEYDMDADSYVETEPGQRYDYRAGGLYHSALASLVTGFVRGKIHRLEHKYSAIMTSTDGFFAEREPDPNDIGNELGQLDVQRGNLRIWRDRLYIFKPHDGGKLKYALHGFRGNVEALRRVPLSLRVYHYSATVMVTLKLAAKSLRGNRYTPGEFIELPFDLAPMAQSP